MMIRRGGSRRRGAVAALEAVLAFPFFLLFFAVMLTIGYATSHKLQTIAAGRSAFWKGRSKLVARDQPMNLGAIAAGGGHQVYEHGFPGGVFDATLTARTQSAVLRGSTWDHTTMPMPKRPFLTPHLDVAARMTGGGFAGVPTVAILGIRGGLGRLGQ